MKICLIGDYSTNLDEGMKNVAFHLAQGLRRFHDVLTLNAGSIFLPAFWWRIKEFNPHIIHYVSGPTLKSLTIVKALKLYCGDVRSIISATQPALPSFSKKLVRLLGPDLILSQSWKTERMFQDIGLKTEFLPNGVDINRFVPVPKKDKETLRAIYKVDKDKFVILHVGSVRKRRNVHIFAELQAQEDVQTIVVGSTTGLMEGRVYRYLINSGCLVWRTYFEKIQQLYALADCYVFPVTYELGSIELPLSIMEAMSCNLPVITTRFGALTRVFEDGEGLYFAEKDEDFVRLLGEVKSSNVEVETREKVLPYSWKEIIKKLEQIYDQVIKE